MTRALRLLVLGALLALTACAQGQAPLPVQGRLEGPYRITRVYDGDTLHLDRVGKVRLVLVDTPESSENQRAADRIELDLGRKAKAFAQHLVETAGRRAWVEVAPEPRDRYGRLLAYVYLPYLEGTTPWRSPEGRQLTQLNYEFIRAGWAEVFVVGSKNRRYLELFQAAQERAKRYSLGIWAVYQRIEREAGRLPLRIRCAVYNPPGPDAGREEIWLEVRRSTRLDGWAVGDDDGLRIPLQGQAQPGVLVVGVPGDPALSNRGDTILLWEPSGKVVDRFDYTGQRGQERACR